MQEQKGVVRQVIEPAAERTTGNEIGRSEGARAAARLQPETGNITAMLQQAAADGRIEQLVDGICGMVRYWRFTGFTQPALASITEHAVGAHDQPGQYARVWLAFGDLALDRADHDAARAQYERALTLYQRAGDVVGEANCMQSLAEIARARSDHDTARSEYEQALTLHQRAGYLLGEAVCVQGLGDIALERSDHDSARAQYERALGIYRRAGYVVGEANCIKGLGDIALRRSDHDAARAQYERALGLYQRAGYVVGEARYIQGLGAIDLARSNYDAARAQYERALMLYQRAGYVLGEANCILGLGDIALRKSDHDTARATYERALGCSSGPGTWSERPTASSAWGIPPWHGRIMTPRAPTTSGRYRYTRQSRSHMRSAGQWSAWPGSTLQVPTGPAFGALSRKRGQASAEPILSNRLRPSFSSTCSAAGCVGRQPSSSSVLRTRVGGLATQLEVRSPLASWQPNALVGPPYLCERAAARSTGAGAGPCQECCLSAGTVTC